MESCFFNRQPWFNWDQFGHSNQPPDPFKRPARTRVVGCLNRDESGINCPFIYDSHRIINKRGAFRPSLCGHQAMDVSLAKAEV
ncbi:MAG: hypothetical protein VYA30_07090 [Myxococcota bacterium]|nr:hypothetical protein [Myxococcota bacterium]